MVEILIGQIKNKIIITIDNIKSSQNLMAIIKNSGWLLLDKLIRMSLGIFVSAWIARYLGPQEFGELAYSLAILALFQAIATLGLDGIVVREISNNAKKAGEVLGSTFLLRFVIGILSWFLSIALFVLLKGIDDRSVYIMALCGACLIFQSLNTIDLWFQSQSQSKRTVLVKLVSYLIVNGLKVTLIIFEAPLPAFAFVVTVDAFIVAIGLVWAYSKFSCGQKWKFEKKRSVKLLKESWPFILSGVSTMIYMRLDQIFVEKYLGSESLGIYAAVVPLSAIWSFIPMTLFVSLAPVVAKKKINDEKEYWSFFTNICRFFAILGWLICIPISLSSDVIVNILFGERYALGGDTLSIIIFCNIFINLGVAQSLWILNEGKSKVSLYQTIIGVAVSIILNNTLIPIYGINGAAISAVLAQFFSCILSNVIFSRKIFLIQVKSMFLIKP